MPRYVTTLEDLEPYIQALVRVLSLGTQGETAPSEFGELPTIIEDRNRLDQLSVTVIWDGWRGMSGECRGRLILEAYARAVSEETVLSIFLPMGLTRAVWERMLEGDG